MKILLLSCSTGEGHNHCALAVKEALDAAGHETSFLDMLLMFGDPGPLSFDKLLNRISSRTPEVFGMMYHAGEMYSSTGVTSPVYLANLRHARQLSAFVTENGYDAVVCSQRPGAFPAPKPPCSASRSCTLWPSPVSRRSTPSSSLRTACHILHAAPMKPPALPTGSSMIPPPLRACCARRTAVCLKTARSASPVSSAVRNEPAAGHLL